MDIIIKTILPKSACTVQMTTAEKTIVARISISVQIPAGTVSIVIDCCWSSFSAWERDMRKFLETLVNQQNAIVETRIRNTATATEHRIRTVLLEVLGFSDR